MMKRLVIFLSVAAVLVAGIATVVIILRARAARVVPPASDAPGASEAGNGDPSSSGTPSITEKPQGILPREQDAPPVLTEAAQKDTDGDGLIDGEEALRGTDPNRRDTDGDGLSDFEEAHSYCTDPLKTSTDGETQDAAWVAARQQEASDAGQRPGFCVE